MEKLKLTGLWKNTDKAGNTYYAGNLSPTVRLLIFKNNFKQGVATRTWSRTSCRRRRNRRPPPTPSRCVPVTRTSGSEAPGRDL